MDGVERQHEDHIFGFVIGKSQRVDIKEVQEERLREAWTEDTIAHKGILSEVKSDTAKSGRTWTAKQVRDIRLLFAYILSFHYRRRYGASRRLMARSDMRGA